MTIINQAQYLQEYDSSKFRFKSYIDLNWNIIGELTIKQNDITVEKQLAPFELKQILSGNRTLNYAFKDIIIDKVPKFKIPSAIYKGSIEILAIEEISSMRKRLYSKGKQRELG